MIKWFTYSVSSIVTNNKLMQTLNNSIAIGLPETRAPVTRSTLRHNSMYHMSINCIPEPAFPALLPRCV